jgi:hypothetical protein
MNGDISKDDFIVPLALLNGEPVNYIINDYIPTGISDNYFKPEIQVYPNPAKEKIYVEVSTEATLEILDMNGRILSEITELKANQKEEINVEELKNGIYMLRFYNKNFSTVRKLVVNK